MFDVCEFCDAVLDETNESHAGFCHLCGAYSGESSFESNDDVDDGLDLVRTELAHVPAILLNHYARSESDLDVLIKLICITYKKFYGGKTIAFKSSDLVHTKGETAGQRLSHQEFEDVILHLGGGLLRIPDPDGLGVLWIAITQRTRLHLPHDVTKECLAELTWTDDAVEWLKPLAQMDQTTYSALPDIEVKKAFLLQRLPWVEISE